MPHEIPNLSLAVGLDLVPLSPVGGIVLELVRTTQQQSLELLDAKLLLCVVSHRIPKEHAFGLPLEGNLLGQ
jgi:hypothetical protein